MSRRSVPLAIPDPSTVNRQPAAAAAATSAMRRAAACPQHYQTLNRQPLPLLPLSLRPPCGVWSLTVPPWPHLAAAAPSPYQRPRLHPHPSAICHPHPFPHALRRALRRRLQLRRLGVGALARGMRQRLHQGAAAVQQVSSGVRQRREQQLLVVAGAGAGTGRGTRWRRMGEGEGERWSQGLVCAAAARVGGRGPLRGRCVVVELGG